MPICPGPGSPGPCLLLLVTLSLVLKPNVAMSHGQQHPAMQGLVNIVAYIYIYIYMTIDLTQTTGFSVSPSCSTEHDTIVLSVLRLDNG